MEVQKVGDISYKEFVKEFLIPGIPVVFKNASKAWKAKDLFTPDYFRKNFGERRTLVVDKEYSMNELLDLIENSTAEKPAPYPCKFNVPVQLPELLPLISPRHLNYAKPNYFDDNGLFPAQKWGNDTELFLGGPAGKFPWAHIDFYHTNAWITQLYGDKNFIVFPRDQHDCMYPKPNDKWVSEVNIFNPDYEKHPKYKNATPITVTVKQGETIFVPNGVWHTAESLTPSISIIFDQVTRTNFSSWFKDIWDKKKKESGKAKAAAIMTYIAGARVASEVKYALGVKSKA